MSEKPQKISKLLRAKAQDFLATRQDNPQMLVEIVRHFESGADLSSCLLTIDLVFSNLLRNRDMYIEVVPLKPVEKTKENLYKEWLRGTYESCFARILETFENEAHKVQVQGLSTAMSLIANEGKYPLECKGTLESYVPIHRLKPVLMKILSSKSPNSHLINKYTEYLLYNDILFFTWKLLPSLTAKSNPNEVYILNFLLLLEKLQLKSSPEPQFLCGNGESLFRILLF